MTNEKSQDLYTKIYWIFTAFMLLSAMPLGIVLIFVKLLERRKKRLSKKIFHPVPGTPAGTQTTRSVHTRPVRESLEEASQKMRRRVGLGLVLSIVCAGLLAVCAMNDISLWTIGWSLFCSLTYFFTGLHTLFSLSRFRNYLAVMEKKPILTVAELAALTGLAEKQIRTDWTQVEFMELLPGTFLDRKQDTLFCF